MKNHRGCQGVSTPTYPTRKNELSCERTYGRTDGRTDGRTYLDLRHYQRNGASRKNANGMIPTLIHAKHVIELITMCP